MSVQLKIKVTKSILERSKNCQLSAGGQGCVTRNCAVALAVRDIFPNASVTGPYMRAKFNDGDDLKIILPRKVALFVSRFDSSTPEQRPNLPELEFEITIPDEVIERINIDELRPLLVNHPTLELI
jgi:hypothetical protein